jgi:16S rRNA (cytosine967-C5)-methyltransferase
MPISPARVTAFEILLRVDQKDAFASELLHSAARQALSVADHRLATELVMGVVRWRSVLDLHIATHSAMKPAKIDPEVLIALRLAAYQLIFLDRVPVRAAIHQSVELVKRARKRSAAPFVNALLRSLASSAPHANPRVSLIESSGPKLAALSAHPPWLVERWIHKFGLDAARQICAYDQDIPETALAIFDPAVYQELENCGIELAPGRLLAFSRRLLRGDLAKLPKQVQERIAIQDEGSQLIARLVGRGSRVLDCCAAPGGKTRLLAAKNPSALVVAADVHPHRARVLRKRVTAENVHVIVADARTASTTDSFDRVLVDVPCSGTGTLARNPEIKWRLKAEDVDDLQARQIAILRSATSALVPSGILVYSTCSLESEENEQVIEKIVSAHPSLRLLDCRERLQQLRDEGELVWPNIDALTSGPYLRTIPGVHPCDGFFAAILEKV